MNTHKLSALTLGLAMSVVVTGCAGTPQTPPPVEATTATDSHGERAGATEVAEPPLALVAISHEGEVELTDLISGEATALPNIDEPQAVESDGRYVYVQTPAGVEIIDSGRWTWDHKDHFHYYRADAKKLGLVPGVGELSVGTGMLSTAGSTALFFSSSQEAVLIDNEALADGDIVERFRIGLDTEEAVVAPFGDGAVIASHGEMRVLDSSGEVVETKPGCGAPSGTITTRVGVVIGCSDGAVLTTGSVAAPTLEEIAYPADAAPVESFASRKGRPRVAGLTELNGFWMLDTRARSWTFTETDEAYEQLIAVDDESEHVVALDDKGVLHVRTGTDSAAPAASISLLEELHNGTTITVDDRRAYVNDPGKKVVYEIDFADSARIARTLTVGVTPDFMAEVGR